MERYLIDYARAKTWCSPDQDYKAIFQAARITPILGQKKIFRLMDRKLSLPTTDSFYHVYQIGSLHPGILKLLYTIPEWVGDQWFNLADVISSTKLYAAVYSATGVMIPRFKVYYMYSRDKDLIFAVQIDKNIPIDMDNEPLYFRFYTNAYYSRPAGDASAAYLHCEGGNPINTEAILQLQSTYLKYKALPGYTWVYKNGFAINKLDVSVVSPKDTIEIVYDGSVKNVVTLTVGDLSTFRSIKDAKYKYLVHFPDDGSRVIDFHDDIEIDILAPTPYGNTKGIYYHRNNPDSHRMVTHRDYSIVVDYLVTIAKYLSDHSDAMTADSQQMKIEMKIRNSGDSRELIYDDSRIFELYKLPDAKLLDAMRGVNSTVDFWKAENLENNDYTKLMGVAYSEITPALITSAMGYNSMSKVVGDTPEKLTLNNGQYMTSVPRGLYENSTVYEYDSKGILLEVHYHATGSDYIANNPLTRMIEVISGKGEYQTDSVLGTDNIPLPTYNNYRVYMCHIYSGIPDNKWQDVTGTNLYSVVNGKLVWANTEPDQYLLVKTDAYFHDYDIDLSMVDGSFYFTLSEETLRDGKVTNSTMIVPPGEMELFLNGHPLIQDLDYIVNFPMVHIVGKDYLIQPADSSVQKVHVRATGFCNNDLTMLGNGDRGFIQHGVLSNNNRFDIRDDKVLRIVVNGALKSRDDLIFSELHQGVSIVNALNGQPYQVKDIIVPLKDLSDDNTYDLRAKSILKDTAVSDYMTLMLPQPDRPAKSAIQRLYPVVSPFISRVLYSLKNGYITDSQISGRYQDSDVMEICKPYEPWLAFDPLRTSIDLDRSYTVVAPHFNSTVVKLTFYQYKFLQNVVRIYGNGIINISGYVNFDN